MAERTLRQLLLGGQGHSGSRSLQGQGRYRVKAIKGQGHSGSFRVKAIKGQGHSGSRSFWAKVDC